MSDPACITRHVREANKYDNIPGSRGDLDPKYTKRAAPEGWNQLIPEGASAIDRQFIFDEVYSINLYKDEAILYTCDMQFREFMEYNESPKTRHVITTQFLARMAYFHLVNVEQLNCNMGAWTLAYRLKHGQLTGHVEIGKVF